MKIKELITKLQSIKPELQGKEIYVFTKNGLLVDPHIGFATKNPFELTKENVEYILIGYE